MYYVLYVSRKLNMDDPQGGDAAIVAAVGKDASGSGAGFGMRDIDFLFETRKEADQARERVVAALPSHETTVVEYEDEEKEED